MEDKLETIKQVIAKYHDYDPAGDPPSGVELVGCYNIKYHNDYGMCFIYPPLGYLSDDKSFLVPVWAYELFSDGTVSVVTNSLIPINIDKCLGDSLDRIYLALSQL